MDFRLWLFSFLGVEVLWADFGYDWFERYEFGGVFLGVVCESFTVFLVDVIIITLQSFSFLYFFKKPFLKFKLLCIDRGVQPELKLLLAFPKLFRVNPLMNTLSWVKMLLMFIIIIFYILSKVGCISVFVKQVIIESVILEVILSVWWTWVWDWKCSKTKSMDKPFRLNHNFSGDLHIVLVLLEDNLLLLEDTPSTITFNISINTWSIINSPLTPGNQLYFSTFIKNFLSSFYFLQIRSMLFFVDIVGNFISSEGKSGP